MALFKISKGLKANLPTTKTSGHCWYTVDDSMFYVDYEDENGEVQRQALNAQNAQTLTGASLSTILNSSDIEIPTSKAVLDALAEVANRQPDWSVNDENSAGYVKNRTHYEVIEEFVAIPSTEVRNRGVISVADTSVLEAGKQCVVTVNGTRYKTTIRPDANLTRDGQVLTYSIGIGSWMAMDMVAASISVVESIDNCPFGLVLMGSTLMFAYESDDVYNGVYTVEVSIINCVVRQLDEKYIPGAIARVEDIPEQIQSDWSVNDDTSPAYVKNKPFGDVTTATDISGDTYTIGEFTSGTLTVEHDAIPLEIGQVWSVQGTNDANARTVSVQKNDDGELYLGTPTVNEMPFYIRATETTLNSSYWYQMQPSHLTLTCVSGVITTASVKQLAQKYIPNADWNVNDENANGYVKHRTHFIYEASGEIFPETHLTRLIDSSSMTLNGIDVDIVANREYSIKWNGENYTCTSVEFESNGILGILIGNVDFVMGTGDSGEPFVVGIMPNDSITNDIEKAFVVPLNEDKEAIISISGPYYEYHKLDERYIPGMHIKEVNKDGNMTNEDFLSLKDGIYFIYQSPLDFAYGLVGIFNGYWRCYDCSYYYGNLYMDGDNLIASEYGALDGFGIDEAMALYSQIFPNDITDGQTVVASFDEFGNVIFKAKDYSEQVQADWNINDATNISYVKNRPFYAEREAVFENLDVEGNLLEPHIFEFELTLAEGASYYAKGVYSCNRSANLMNVEFEGTYKCVNGEIAIFPYEHSGEPVLIVRPNQVYLGLGNNYDKASVTFYTLEKLTKYHKIDANYLPDNIATQEYVDEQLLVGLPKPDWNETDETSLSYIKNKPEIATDDEIIEMLAQEDVLPVVTDADGGILADENENILLW